MTPRGGSAVCMAVCITSVASCGARIPTPAAGSAEQGASSSLVPPSALEVLRGSSSGGAANEGFARALTVRAFEFPRDHGPHPQFRHEWWYWTGHLEAANGARFGFELTFFRIALAPPAAGGSPASLASPAASGPTENAASESHWRARQIYVAHFAITDIGRKQFHSAARYARDALGLAGAQAMPPRVWLEGWSLADTPRDAGGDGDWMLKASDSDYGLRLDLHALGPPVLNGERGLSVKSDAPRSASYYYSIPRLSARGALTVAGRALPVSGIAWLDREWGSGSLGPHEQGWDWFALQLADGSALMFYSLRDAGGAPDPHSAGTWIAADGSTRALASEDVRIDIQDHWRSPHGDLYPSRWRVRSARLALDVSAAPVLADQELETTPRYWEGDVAVSGTKDGRPISGAGYVELVGYSSR